MYEAEDGEVEVEEVASGRPIEAMLIPDEEEMVRYSVLSVEARTTPMHAPTTSDRGYFDDLIFTITILFS